MSNIWGFLVRSRLFWAGYRGFLASLENQKYPNGIQNFPNKILMVSCISLQFFNAFLRIPVGSEDLKQTLFMLLWMSEAFSRTIWIFRWVQCVIRELQVRLVESCGFSSFYYQFPEFQGISLTSNILEWTLKNSNLNSQQDLTEI